MLCCLGTTRRDAGSAARFREIDHDYVLNAARVARAAGVRHWSYVSSSGADANSFFLYMKTKGQTEEDLKALGFPVTTIWRPGMLGRGSKARFWERVVGWVAPTLDVATLGAALVRDAEAVAAEAGEAGEAPVVTVRSDAAARRLGSRE